MIAAGAGEGGGGGVGREGRGAAGPGHTRGQPPFSPPLPLSRAHRLGVALPVISIQSLSRYMYNGTPNSLLPGFFFSKQTPYCMVRYLEFSVRLSKSSHANLVTNKLIVTKLAVIKQFNIHQCPIRFI